MRAIRIAAVLRRFCDFFERFAFVLRCFATWPLHDIAITDIVWCMASKGGFGGGGVYCAMVVQYFRNRVGFAGGGGATRG